MNSINGFKPIPWAELKTLLRNLPEINEPVLLNPAEKIIGNKEFIESHIATIDAVPPNVKGLNTQQEKQRKAITPYYERILKYYYIRIQLIEA